MEGSTGSGFTSLLMERLTQDYRKKSKIAFPIFCDSDFQHEELPMGPYHQILSSHFNMEHADVIFPFDTISLSRISRDFLFQEPDHTFLNGIVAR
jgi:tubulin alpha